MTAIYLKHGDEFVAMDEAPYAAEEVLQRLLADHPALLAGGDGEGETQWLLIAREAGVPDREGGVDRWSLDHLFVDREGVPTFVEVKRSTDTRARREVVAQMLDYAANAPVHWARDHLRTTFEARVGGREQADELVAELTGSDDVDQFWMVVGDNLEARRLRLVFVADEISLELRRIIEFLNEQMERTDVLALEVRQYVERGGERATLVPKLIGDTARAHQVKGRSSTPTAKLAPGAVREALARVEDPARRRRLVDLYDFLGGLDGVRPSLGTASETFWLGEADGRPVNPSLWLDGSVGLDWRHVRRRWEPAALRAAAERIGQVTGMKETIDQGLAKDLNTWMRADAVVASDEALDEFKAALLEIVGRRDEVSA
jgi:hypothetical protein